MAGHVFVLDGDLNRLRCDAWLLPTDEEFRVEQTFGWSVGLPGGGYLNADWGGRRVIPWRTAEDDKPDIWLGNVGAFRPGADWFASIVDPFVQAAAARLDGRVERARPLLACNVLGSGAGGMSAEKGELYGHLIPAMHEAASRHEVDLALVTYGRRAYSAAQRMRAQVLGYRSDAAPFSVWDLGAKTDALHRVARDLARHARNDNLVLFLGAGVSTGAGVPAWQALLDHLAAVIGGVDVSALRQLDLRDQAAILQRRYAKANRSLAQEVSGALGRTHYSLLHGLLASLPARETVTTNFDLLFEAAASTGGARIRVLPYEPVQPGERWLLKLHGSIDRGESIVLTREDYLGAPMRHAALFGLVQAMLLTRHMLFVGYSLRDEDFHQLVHEVRAARLDVDDRPGLGTALTLFEDPLFAELWDDDLHAVAMAPALASNAAPDAIRQAVRRLEIFLDLVGFEAADLDAFILDPSYERMLEPDEADLRDALLDLAARRGDAAGWRKVDDLLSRFGLRPD